MPVDRPISGLALLAGDQLADGDLFETVDVSDTTDAATGTNKGIGATGLALAVQSRITRIGVATYFTSRTGAVSDASLSINVSTTAGTTDNWAVLSPLFSLAGPKRIVVDGRYCVGWGGNGTDPTMKGLVVPGNTEVVVLPGCGFILRDDANCPLIRNANPRAGTTAGTANIVDENITIDGGIWHFNATHQVHDTFGTDWGWVVGMFWAGVRNHRLQNVTLYRPRTFAVHYLNWEKVYHTNLNIDATATEGFNYNGIQCEGPGLNYDADTLRVAARDDCLAFNADDGLHQPGVTNFSPYFTGGPIVHIDVRNLHGETNNQWGMVRLLSGGSLIDDVVFDGITGSCSLQLAIIDNLSEFDPSALVVPGPGNFGDVTFRNVNVSVQTTGYKDAYFYVNAKGRRLTIENVKRTDSPVKIPTVLAGSGYAFDELDVVDLDVRETGAANYTQLDLQGQVGLVRVRDSAVRNTNAAPTGTGELVRVRPGATMTGELRLENLHLDGQTYAARLQCPTAPLVRAHNVSHLKLGAAGAATLNGPVILADGCTIARLRTGKLLASSAVAFDGSGFGRVLDHVTDNSAFADATALPFYDSFSGAAGLLTAHNRDMGTGSWAAAVGAFSLTGAGRVKGTAFDGTTHEAAALYDGGTANVTITFAVVANTKMNAGLWFNTTDALSGWLLAPLALPSLVTAINLYRADAGTLTQVATFSPFAPPSGVLQRFRVQTAGDNVTVWWDSGSGFAPVTGMNPFTAAGRAYKTLTKFGLRQYNSGGLTLGADDDGTEFDDLAAN